MTDVDRQISALNECQMRLGAFWQRMSQGISDSTLSAQRSELLKRVSQCEFCLGRIKELDELPDKGWRATTASALAPEIETMTEAFYYFAWRLLCLCKPLGLGDGRRSVPSIRQARNQMIEHPEKNGGVMGRSFAWGGVGGPELKPLSRGGDRPRWPGLYHHVDELVIFLRAGLTRVGA